MSIIQINFCFYIFLSFLLCIISKKIVACIFFYYILYVYIFKFYDFVVFIKLLFMIIYSKYFHF